MGERASNPRGEWAVYTLGYRGSRRQNKFERGQYPPATNARLKYVDGILDCFYRYGSYSVIRPWCACGACFELEKGEFTVGIP